MSVYIPTVWKNGAPPAINGANLNKMEAGVQSAHTEIDNIVAGVTPVLTATNATNATNVTGQIPLSSATKVGGAKMSVTDGILTIVTSSY